MRFAIVGSRGYPSTYGGFETLVRHLAPFLAGQGHDVIVYGRAAGRPSRRISDGVEVRETRGVDHKSISTLSHGLTAAVDLARAGCDAALVLNVANGFYLPHLSRAGIATCVNVDGLEWMRSKWGYVARTVFLRGAAATAKHADAIVFDSEALADAWSERFGVTGHFIPYGAPVLHEVGAARLHDAELPVDGYVLVVARLVPENNVDLVLDALPHLPLGTPLVIVGDANYEHTTVKRVRALADGIRVHWLGHVDDQGLLDELWANAAVYWHGHSVGGTNPGLLQALGAGAPTLALDTPFNREVVGHDDQLVEPEPRALAERITSLLGSTSLAETFRARGQHIVGSRYAWPAVCAEYELLLERLVAQDASGQRRDVPRATWRPRWRTGRIVVLVGPDGAGKTTLTLQLEATLAAQELEVSSVNFRERIVDDLLRRPRSTNGATDPTGTPNAPSWAATAKAFALWLDLALSARRWRRVSRRRITLVERYVYDFAVDPRRLGLARVPARLRSLAVRWSAAPDAIVVCRAPANVLAERKAELDESEIGRQYRCWDALAPSLDVPILEVDTANPVDVDGLATRVLETIEA